MQNKVSAFYYVGRWLAWLAFRLLTDWQVKGHENVPARGPLLIIANHMNNADPPLVAMSVRRKMMFMAKEELFRSGFSAYFVSRFGSFPVYRGKLDIAAMRRCKQVLSSGWGLVMFPEGMRSQIGCMIPAFPGSAMIAAHNDVAILPVGITGTENMVGKSWFLKRPRVTVTIGKPFTLPHDGKLTKEQLEDMTTEIMCRIAALIPPQYHGYYTEKAAEKCKLKSLVK